MYVVYETYFPILFCVSVPKRYAPWRMSLFFWSITVMAVYVWESGSLSPTWSLFSAGSCWSNLQLCNQQNFLLCGLSLSWERKALGFFTTLNDNCPLKRAGQLCMYGDNRKAWIAISGCLLSFWSHFKQPLVSGIKRSKLAKCIDLQPKFRRSKNFYLLFFH